MGKITKMGYMIPTLASFAGVELISHSQLGLIVGAVIGYGVYKLGPKEVDISTLREKLIEFYPGDLKPRGLFQTADVDEIVESAPAPHEAEPEPEEETQEVVASVAAIFPSYPDDETLRLGRVLGNNARFDPHIDGLFGKGLIASAVQGSGKSTLNRLIIEQAGKCGVPVVVFDHKGEYGPITELPFVLGMRAGSDALQSRIGPSCFRLTPENADKFVACVMEGRYQAIIDLPSYGDGWLERADIVAAVGQALMRWSARQREMGGVLLPCLVFLDEAQLYIPQNVNLLPPEAQKNREVLDSLSNAYFALVSNGRSNGYTVCFSTQSLTYIAKWAIKSCQIKVFGRHTEKNDLDMCESIISSKVASREDIETFAPGVAVVFGFTPQAMVVSFDKSQSRDISETPGISRLRQRQTVRQQQSYAPQQRSHDYQLNEVDADALIAEIMGRADYDPQDRRYMAPREQRAQHNYQPVQTPRPAYERMPDLPPAQPVQQPQRHAKYQQALEVWNAGNQSVRTFARAMGMGESAAYKMLTDMDKLGLIQMKKKQ